MGVSKLKTEISAWAPELCRHPPPGVHPPPLQCWGVTCTHSRVSGTSQGSCSILKCAVEPALVKVPHAICLSRQRCVLHFHSYISVKRSACPRVHSHGMPAAVKESDSCGMLVPQAVIPVSAPSLDQHRLNAIECFSCCVSSTPAEACQVGSAEQPQSCMSLSPTLPHWDEACLCV